MKRREIRHLLQMAFVKWDFFKQMRAAKAFIYVVGAKKSTSPGKEAGMPIFKVSHIAKMKAIWGLRAFPERQLLFSLKALEGQTRICLLVLSSLESSSHDEVQPL